MYRALSAEQSRAAEERAVSSGGVTLAELMERAGTALAEVVADAAPDGLIAVLCGPGNNGGDGWVAARQLRAHGRDVLVTTAREPVELPQPGAAAAQAAIAAGVEWAIMNDAPDTDLLDRSAVVVDALLGTGSTLPLRDPLCSWCRALNSSGSIVVAADLPTGVHADTGAADPDAVRADVTVAFASPKRGHVLHPGAGLTGELIVTDIGIPVDEGEMVGAPEIWTNAEYASALPRPAADAHKNERGRVLIIAGSGRYPGAAVLAARGAMRCGAGYVTLAVPDPVTAIVQSHLTAAPVVGFPASRSKTFSSSASQRVLELAGDYDAVVIGPGLTLADGAVALVREVVSRFEGPLVIDADGLNALVDAVELITARTAPTVLTPHPGELARLLGVSSEEVGADRVSFSARLSSATCAVVLKGAGTLVSGAGRTVVNTSGSVALATAGTGDVLAGMTGALMAGGAGPLDAGALGAHLHGRAGDHAAAALTPFCVTAQDVPDAIPAAMAELLETW